MSERKIVIFTPEERLESLLRPRKPVTIEEARKSVQYGLSLGPPTRAYVAEEKDQSSELTDGASKIDDVG